MQLIVVWTLHAREALNNANKDWLQFLKRDIPEAQWLPLHSPNSAIPLHTHQRLASNNWRKKFQSLPHDIYNCSHRCPEAMAAYHPAIYKHTFTSKIKEWRDIANTDGSVIKRRDESLPLAGSGVHKPSGDITQPSQQLQLHIKPNGHGPAILSTEQH
eukprot:scaffold97919_cov19-Tisochrysis_lutea.AAC.2